MKSNCDFPTVLGETWSLHMCIANRQIEIHRKKLYLNCGYIFTLDRLRGQWESHALVSRGQTLLPRLRYLKRSRSSCLMANYRKWIRHHALSPRMDQQCSWAPVCKTASLRLLVFKIVWTRGACPQMHSGVGRWKPLGGGKIINY